MVRSFRDNPQFKLSPYIKFAGTLSASVTILFRILAKEKMQTMCMLTMYMKSSACVTVTHKRAANSREY